MALLCWLCKHTASVSPGTCTDPHHLRPTWHADAPPGNRCTNAVIRSCMICKPLPLRSMQQAGGSKQSSTRCTSSSCNTSSRSRTRRSVAAQFMMLLFLLLPFISPPVSAQGVFPCAVDTLPAALRCP
jgi:hypothetical protein